MQILTITDEDFTEVLRTLKEAKVLGKYWKNGKVQVVYASPQFMLVSHESNIEKIAIKPARSQQEAVNMGMQLLTRERQRGSDVEMFEE